MGWPAGDGSPEPQPDDFRLPKGPARKKKKGKKKKEATGGSPGSIAKRVAVTRIGRRL